MGSGGCLGIGLLFPQKKLMYDLHTVKSPVLSVLTHLWTHNPHQSQDAEQTHITKKTPPCHLVVKASPQPQALATTDDFAVPRTLLFPKHHQNGIMQPIPFLVCLLSVSITPPSPSYCGRCHEEVPDAAAPPCVHPQAEGPSHRPCPSVVTDQHPHAGCEWTWTSSPLGSVSVSRTESRGVCVRSRRIRPGHPARHSPCSAPASDSVRARAGVGCVHSSRSAKSAACPRPWLSRACPSSLATSAPHPASLAIRVAPLGRGPFTSSAHAFIPRLPSCGRLRTHVVGARRCTFSGLFSPGAPPSPSGAFRAGAAVRGGPVHVSSLRTPQRRRFAQPGVMKILYHTLHSDPGPAWRGFLHMAQDVRPSPRSRVDGPPPTPSAEHAVPCPFVREPVLRPCVRATLPPPRAVLASALWTLRTGPRPVMGAAAAPWAVPLVPEADARGAGRAGRGPPRPRSSCAEGRAPPGPYRVVPPCASVS